MSRPIRVSLVRSGGVGGIRRTASLDSESLGPEAADRLRRLVEAADLAHVSEPTIRSTRDRDRFHYTLMVDQAGFQHVITFAEERTPVQIQPLIEMVWQEGQPNPEDTQSV